MEEAAWLFELAVLLHTTVGHLVDEMPGSELVMWRKYILEPRGERRADWNTATLAKAVHDVGLGFAGHKNDQQLDSYLLKFAVADPEEVTARNLKIARAIFGKVVPSC